MKVRQKEREEKNSPLLHATSSGEHASTCGIHTHNHFFRDHNTWSSEQAAATTTMRDNHLVST